MLAVLEVQRRALALFRKIIVRDAHYLVVPSALICITFSRTTELATRLLTVSLEPLRFRGLRALPKGLCPVGATTELT